MTRAQLFRHLEASLVMLAMLQAQRVALSAGLGDWERFGAGGVLPLGLLLSVICLVLLPGSNLLPRRKSWLPALLLASSISVIVLRFAAALPMQPAILQVFALLVMLAAAAYFATLMRASWRPALRGLVAALALDILLRSINTYDVSLQPLHSVNLGEQTYLFPWALAQGLMGLIHLGLSLLARRQARQESYEPARVTLGVALSLAGALTLFHALLGSPNVIGRWAGLPYEAVLPWLLLTTWLALDPTVRRLAESIENLLQPQLRAWVWLALLVLLLVLGARTTGPLAAAALIAAQLVSLGLLTWRPLPPLRDQRDFAGFFAGLGIALGLLLSAIFDVLMHQQPQSAFPADLALLLAAAVLNAGRLILARRDEGGDPQPALRNLVWLAGAPTIVLGMLLALGNPAPLLSSASTLRVASYNINGGFDELGRYQMELIALSIEASRADVIILQEVDAGSPASLGVDQLSYLAHRLGMNSYFQPDASRLRGSALLSRYPVVEVSGYALPDESGRATLIQALIFNPGTGDQVRIVGGQLSPGAVDSRLRQLAVLLNIAGQGGPTLLAFDLNTSPEDIVYQQVIGSGFVDPDSFLGIERGFTTPATQPVERHDYLLVAGLEILDARQVDSTASDHRLVVIETSWRPAP